MEKVKEGVFVSVEYTGTLDDGHVFDTSRGRSPLEVEMGSGGLIHGFENALMGMSVNEKKTFTLDPKEAYGQRDESLKKSFSRDEVPPGMEPKIGQNVALTGPQGQQLPGWISSVDEKEVVIDLNHPLAGKSLTFEVEVVGIHEEPTERQSCESGKCGSGCSC
jgi:peptidylprolyl isomerase